MNGRTLAGALAFLLGSLAAPGALRAQSAFQNAPDFEPEGSVALRGPQALLEVPPGYLLYEIDSGSVEVSSSPDGVTWASAVTFNDNYMTGAGVLPLNDGTFRLYYTTDIGATHELRSQTSADGLTFGSIETHRSGVQFLAGPAPVRLSNAAVQLYFIQGSDRTNPNTWQLFRMTSLDEGRTFGGAEPVSFQGSPASAYDVAIATIAPRRFRVLFLSIDAVGQANTELNPKIDPSHLIFSRPITATSVKSFLTTNNGTTLVEETGTRFGGADSGGSRLDFIAVARSTERWAWRLYGDDTSAITRTPAPQEADPDEIPNSETSATLTLRGEVFAAPASRLSARLVHDESGAAIPLALSRGSDREISASISTLGRPLGVYRAEVTDTALGTTGVLQDAFEISLAPGRVDLFGNIFRPKNGERVRIEALVFLEARLRARVFTPAGAIVRELYNQITPPGQTTLYWDGRTESGALAVSGVYMLHVDGANTDRIRKIVLIR